MSSSFSRDSHNLYVLLCGLESHQIRNVFARDKQRLRQLLLAALRLLQHAAKLSSRGLNIGDGNELQVENVATRRVHQCDTVEVPITVSPNRRVVDAERYPGFVDLELFRMKHAKTFPVTPNAANQRRADARNPKQIYGWRALAAFAC